jgi:HD superfamily phosphohydrolase YqeK
LLFNNLTPFRAFLDEGSLAQVEKTWIAGGLDDPSWSNILGHLAAVTALGIAIYKYINFGDMIPEAATAGLIHDAFKRREQEAIKAAREAKADESATYDQQALLQEQFLLANGWSPEIVKAAQSVGHTSLEEFCTSFSEIPLLRKIIHLADDLTAGDSYEPLAARMEKNRKKYPTIDADGPTRYHLPGLTFDVQEQLALQLIDEFAEMADMAPKAFYSSIIERAKEILGV